VLSQSQICIRCRSLASELGDSFLKEDVRVRLEGFAELLLRWNATLNLVGPSEPTTVWSRHIADSLQLEKLFPPGLTRAVDLGTGGGFPGLVLAIATGVPFDLIEADRRKAAFLRTAVIESGASATVHNCRVEEAAVMPASLVTARALAPLQRLLPLASHLLAPGGICLFLKGAKAEEELREASKSWTMTVDKFQSATDSDGVVLRVSELQRKNG
jgi:16S rRNA (guanine527-N7)-methyltransferase